MITLSNAIKILLQQFPDCIPASGVETENEWIFSLSLRETSEDLDISPYAVSKLDGKIRVFFPPKDASQIQNFKELSQDFLNLP